MVGEELIWVIKIALIFFHEIDKNVCKRLVYIVHFIEECLFYSVVCYRVLQCDRRDAERAWLNYDFVSLRSLNKGAFQW